MFKYTPIYSGGNAPQMIEEDVFKMIVPLSFEEEGVVQKTTQKNQIRLGEVLGERLDEKLGKNQLQIINLMRNKPAISIVKIAEKLGISDTAVENNIKKLKTLEIIKRIGPNKGGHWEVVKGKP
ncbi:MAG TPA: winged helix-turn-helix transcriptional regulator [Bacteroidetes bacterium]|nr:winged helix-turn-helix transcriptional regulator [Bacteroidota bacterium]